MQMAAIEPSDLLRPLLANWPYLVIAGLIFISIKVLTSPTFKGWFGELMVKRGLRQLPADLYRNYSDLYLPRPDGLDTTQIDHVVVSPFGIFVIETKNYRGWIFGSEKQRQWTQQIYRRKHRFQNPLHQNLLHVKALAQFLELDVVSFHSLVIFVGDCEFKTEMPDHVIHSGLSRWILKHEEEILETKETSRCNALLTKLDQETDRRVAAKEHLKNLKQRHL